MRGSRRAWIPVLLSSLAPVVAGAADSCKLSPRQQADSVKAFRSLYPIFQDPRCLNCHGGVNPFAPDGDHAGGFIDMREVAKEFLRQPRLDFLLNESKPEHKAAEVARIREIASSPNPVTNVDEIRAKAMAPMSGACRGCHVESWGIASPKNRFVGLDWKKMCVHIKSSSLTRTAEAFKSHMDSDSFTLLGFEGLRGLLEKSAPKPPAMPFETMKVHRDAWIEAMGGKFPAPAECGCEVDGLVLEIRHRLYIDETSKPKALMGDTRFESEVVLDAWLEDLGTGWYGADVRVRRPMDIRYTQSAQAKCTGTGWRDENWSVRARFDQRKGFMNVEFSFLAENQHGDIICRLKGMKFEDPWDDGFYGDMTSVEMPAEYGATGSDAKQHDYESESITITLVGNKGLPMSR